MNALELLKNDHNSVNDLFNEIEDRTDPSERRALYKKIYSELMMHTYIEEKVLYPYFSDKQGFQEIVEESYSEHQKCKSLLQKINVLNDESNFQILLSELINSVRHHVMEEEGTFFPKIADSVDNEELEKLGHQLQSAKETPLQDEMAA